MAPVSRASPTTALWDLASFPWLIKGVSSKLDTAVHCHFRLHGGVSFCDQVADEN